MASKITVHLGTKTDEIIGEEKFVTKVIPVVMRRVVRRWSFRLMGSLSSLA